jgi:hypothetical protein
MNITSTSFNIFIFCLKKKTNVSNPLVNITLLFFFFIEINSNIVNKRTLTRDLKAHIEKWVMLKEYSRTIVIINEIKRKGKQHFEVKKLFFKILKHSIHCF